MRSMETIPRMSEVASMLGNESRLILLQLLSNGEKSVELLSEESGIPVANTSQHLQALKKRIWSPHAETGKEFFTVGN